MDGRNYEVPRCGRENKFRVWTEEIMRFLAVEELLENRIRLGSGEIIRFLDGVG